MKIVVISGIDGAGKTTQCKALEAALIKIGIPAVRLQHQMPLRQLAHRLAWKDGFKNAYGVFSANTLATIGLLEFLQTLVCQVSLGPENGVLILDRYLREIRAISIMSGLDDFKEFDFVADKFPEVSKEFYLKIPTEVAVSRIVNRNMLASGKEEPRYLSAYALSLDEQMERCDNVSMIDATLDAREISTNILSQVEKMVHV